MIASSTHYAHAPPIPPSYRRPTRLAIVYLTQGKHSSYKDRDTQANLHMSVRLLYRNYNAAHRDDVLFLHAPGDVTLAQRQSILALCTPGTARFHELAAEHFALPDGHRAWAPPARWRYMRRFSVGYRHMIRFFAIGLWPTMEALGYEYVMRLDDDSYIWSPIHRSLSATMDARGLDYVYRLASWERGHVQTMHDGFHELVRSYARRHALDLRWLLGPCDLANATTTAERAERFSFDHCGSMYAIYNNFFATRVSFWRRANVAAFLRFASESGTIYTQRYGDALWHAAALAMFMSPMRLALLDDFAYEHATRTVYHGVRLPNGKSVHYCRSSGVDGNSADGNGGRSDGDHDGNGGGGAPDGANGGGGAPDGVVIAQQWQNSGDDANAIIRRGPPCADEAADEPNGCLSYGGIALATGGAAAQPEAIERLSNLSLAALRCPEPDSLYRSACLYAPHGRLLGLFAMWVTVEQLDCTRGGPLPFFCDTRAFNRSGFTHFAHELQHLRRIATRLAAPQPLKPNGRLHRVLHQNIDSVFAQRQRRAACSNWCFASASPSPSEYACYGRAYDMFKQLAARRPVGDTSALMIRSTTRNSALSLWNRRLGRPNPMSGDVRDQEWKFADNFVIPANRSWKPNKSLVVVPET